MKKKLEKISKKDAHEHMEKHRESKSSKHEKHEKKEHKKVVEKAMKHPDKLGAGAKKRKHLAPKTKEEVVMKEFKRGTLNSGSGQKVKSRSQAIAIALSEGRKAGESIKPKKKK